MSERKQFKQTNYRAEKKNTKKNENNSSSESENDLRLHINSDSEPKNESESDIDFDLDISDLSSGGEIDISDMKITRKKSESVETKSPQNQRLEQASSVVSRIEDTLKTKKNELKPMYKEKFLDFLNRVKRVGLERITPQELHSIQNYLHHVTRKSDEWHNEYDTEIKKQTIIEAIDLVNFIEYNLENEKKQLSSVQKDLLKRYLTHILNVGVDKIAQNDVISIQNHIISAIYKEKKEIMDKIDESIELYSKNSEKVKILEELKNDLKLIQDNILCRADSVYFTEQLKLLLSGRFIIREHLIALIDDEFLRQDISTYPHTYVDRVNKLKNKIRRKPFILPETYKNKTMNRLKNITHVYKYIPYFY